MTLMTIVLVVMVELMKVTNSDDDDIEWNKARALSEPGEGSCISGVGLMTPSSSAVSTPMKQWGSQFHQNVSRRLTSKPSYRGRIC